MVGDTSFGAHLRAARLAADLSQSGLEALSGIPKARISRYENDHVAPSIRTLRRLARSLGVSDAALIGDRRAILLSFVEALASRGITIGSADQGRQLATVIADLVEAAGGTDRLASGAPAVPPDASGHGPQLPASKHSRPCGP